MLILVYFVDDDPDLVRAEVIDDILERELSKEYRDYSRKEAHAATHTYRPHTSTRERR